MCMYIHTLKKGSALSYIFTFQKGNIIFRGVIGDLSNLKNPHVHPACLSRTDQHSSDKGRQSGRRFCQ